MKILVCCKSKREAGFGVEAEAGTAPGKGPGCIVGPWQPLLGVLSDPSEPKISLSIVVGQSGEHT